MDLDDKIKKMWDNAEDCNCSTADCWQNHKLCGICKKKVIYGAHESNQPGSKFAWNKDHIIPSSRWGSESLKNLQVLCIPCNRDKSNK